MTWKGFPTRRSKRHAAAQAALAHGDGDGGTGVYGVDASLEAVGGTHGDAAGDVVADVLGHFTDQGFVALADLDGVEQIGKLAIRKADIQNGAEDLRHGPGMLIGQ